MEAIEPGLAQVTRRSDGDLDSAFDSARPRLVRIGGQFVALFGGFGAGQRWLGVWAAVSADGRSWRCATPEPLLSDADIPGSQGIHTMASVPLADGRIGLIMESLVTDRSELWWATVELTAE